VGYIAISLTVLTVIQLSDYLSSANGLVKRYTPVNSDIDSRIESILVLSGERIAIDQDQIPEYFWPVTGKWKMRGIYHLNTT